MQKTKVTAETLCEAGINGATEQGKNIFRIPHGERGVVIYYPTTNKWQHKGRVREGSVADLADWLRTN